MSPGSNTRIGELRQASESMVPPCLSMRSATRKGGSAAAAAVVAAAAMLAGWRLVKQCKSILVADIYGGPLPARSTLRILISNPSIACYIRLTARGIVGCKGGMIYRWRTPAVQRQGGRGGADMGASDAPPRLRISHGVPSALCCVHATLVAVPVQWILSESLLLPSRMRIALRRCCRFSHDLSRAAAVSSLSGFLSANR